jgi:hypothetical protein
VAEIGTILRKLHAATASFDPPAQARWQPWFARSLPGRRPVIGHGDLGPWNILAREGRPVALIDWDNAGPVDATWELAQVAWLNVQLHDDDQFPQVDEQLLEAEAANQAFTDAHPESPWCVGVLIEHEGEWSLRAAGHTGAIGMCSLGPRCTTPLADHLWKRSCRDFPADCPASPSDVGGQTRTHGLHPDIDQ